TQNPVGFTPREGSIPSSGTSPDSDSSVGGVRTSPQVVAMWTKEQLFSQPVDSHRPEHAGRTASRTVGDALSGCVRLAAGRAFSVGDVVGTPMHTHRNKARRATPVPGSTALQRSNCESGCQFVRM